MMAVQPVAFGKNLRPSTVDVMNKLNEVISALNSIDSEGIGTLKADIEALKVSDANQSAQIGNLQTSLDSLEPRVAANESDVRDIKVTLYTPLESTEGA